MISQSTIYLFQIPILFTNDFTFNTMANKIAEAIAVVEDMRSVYDSTEDLQLIQSIRTNASEILEICQQKEQTVKDIIRGSPLILCLPLWSLR